MSFNGFNVQFTVDHCGLDNPIPLDLTVHGIWVQDKNGEVDFELPDGITNKNIELKIMETAEKLVLGEHGIQ